MSDLISRNAVIKFIQEEIKQDIPDDFKIRTIQRVIEDMPVAYDIDMVMERLQKITDRLQEIIERCEKDFNDKRFNMKEKAYISGQSSVAEEIKSIAEEIK